MEFAREDVAGVYGMVAYELIKIIVKIKRV
jgi:hypothetical protein